MIFFQYSSKPPSHLKKISVVCGADLGSEGKQALAPLDPEGRKQEVLLGDRGEAALWDRLSYYLLTFSLIKNVG